MAITEFDARQLVEAHQAGDERAFSEIARLAYPSLYSHALRRLRDHHAAEDAVQEAFVRAYRALPGFEGEFRLQAWLHRILANVCLDEGARRSRELDVVERVGSLAERSVADPADLTVTAATRASVARALAGLPDPYRDAVALRYLDDLSYRDIGLATGVSEENARARASRGRVALQRVLGRSLGVLAFVIPGLRRAPRTAVVADPSVAAPSAGLAEHAGQLAVTNGAATPLTNLSAQMAGHFAQATPVVTRIAEVSASMGAGKSSTVANVVGAIAAMVMPVAAATIVDQQQQPAPQSVEVAAALPTEQAAAPGAKANPIPMTVTSALDSLTTLMTVDAVDAGSSSTTSSTTSTTVPPPGSKPARGVGPAKPVDTDPSVPAAAPAAGQPTPVDGDSTPVGGSPTATLLVTMRTNGEHAGYHAEGDAWMQVGANAIVGSLSCNLQQTTSVAVLFCSWTSADGSLALSIGGTFINGQDSEPQMRFEGWYDVVSTTSSPELGETGAVVGSLRPGSDASDVRLQLKLRASQAALPQGS